MIINLYNYNDEKNVINKILPDAYPLTGTLKNNTSMTDPIIRIEIENPDSFNYAEIPEFGRFYFVVDATCIRANMWDILLHVDVLKSFADEIKNCYAVLANTENVGSTEYLYDSMYKSLVKDKTDIISFSSGFLNSGEYILITAGG